MSDDNQLNEKKIARGARFKEIRIVNNFTTKRAFAEKITGNKHAKSSLVGNLESGKNFRFFRLIQVARAINATTAYIIALNNEIEYVPYVDNSEFEERLNAEVAVVCDNLLYFRKLSGISQLDAELESFINRSNISKYEHGRILEMDTIFMLAIGYKIEPYLLFIKHTERK